MIDFDFLRIRTFDGSKDGGFEELICQLAHLNKPQNGHGFIRKDGAGGDAGVECFWKLKDDTEHAWQAKYFTERLENNEWNQINGSVITALTKHPNLTKYYICVPRDFNDSRKNGPNGKPVTSSLDKWQQYVKEWTELAQSKNMNVEFIYWGRHELNMMLQTEETNYIGKAFYWFNEPMLSEEVFENITNKSRVAIGERFSDEYHVDLPISKKIDGLGLSQQWHSDINKQTKTLNSLLNQINELDRYKRTVIDKGVKWNEFKGRFMSFRKIYSVALDEQYVSNQFEIARIEIELLEQVATEFNDFCWDNIASNDEWKEIRSKFRKILDEITDINSFVFSINVQAYESKSAVILGEAGIGKSHLLCDIALKRLDENLPTVFLLGQKYSGGNPLNFLAEELDLKTVSYKQLLGALDAAGEAKGTRTLIIVDALNEGNYRLDWINHLTTFAMELKKYPHISLLLSCRETYEEAILPNSISEHIIKIPHEGFRGYEHRAAMKYLAQQGIDKPSMPIFSPEFSNPLFLKTCCKAIKTKNLSSFPKGLEGQTAIFDFYLESIEEIIRVKKGYFSGQKVVSKVVEAIVKQMYPNNMFGIEINEAWEMMKSIDPKPYFNDDLITLLTSEGLLALDIITDNNGVSKEVVRFTYERFSDYFIVESLMNNLDIENVESEFEEDGIIGRLIKDCYRYSGLIEALGVAFPEKLNREFIDFISKEDSKYKYIFDKSFTDVLLLRNKLSITDRSIKLLNKITGYGYFKESLEKLLALATEPGHPLNADFLHRNLKRFTMPERDHFWSTHIAISDYEEEENQPETITRTLINWSLDANLAEVEKERIRLLSYALLWMTTTSNRKVRDQVTKSLVRILCTEPSIVVDLLTEFDPIDDIYLKERLYAVTYGVVCNNEDIAVVKQIAETVYELQFVNGSPYPHLLLRDYARGVMENALYRNLIEEDKISKFRPPYKSEWPIENPVKSELENLVGEKYSSIMSSLMGLSGDFGNYTMSCIHDWSPTKLTEEQPEKAYQLHLKFVEKLPDDLKAEYLAEINARIESYSKERIVTIIDDIQEEFEAEEPWEFSFSTRNIDTPSNNWETLKEKINNVLSEEDKETFRWITGLGVTNRLAKFSRKWAQRWVCKRAYELGWKKDLFEDFEQTHSSNYGRGTSTIERIGKKYQWIAFYELLARMSDNLYWAGDFGEEDAYEGPWQLRKRDIDPTIWLRATKDSGWDEFGGVWWSTYIPVFSSDDSEKWVFDETRLPDFKELLKITNLAENKKWYVLRGFRKWTNKSESNEYKEELWYRVNACIVKKENVPNVLEKMKNQALFDPSIFSPLSSSHQGFLREYPWHPYYEFLDEWRNDEDNRILDIEHLVPTNEYEWETGERDKSIDQSISIYLPNSLLIKDLELVPTSGNFSAWKNSANDMVFLDPSEQEKGPSFALLNATILDNWLLKNDLQLIWFIGGEKQIYNSKGNVTKWLEFIYTITAINGKLNEQRFFKEGTSNN
ncbi:NACHT domain-containing protein [Sporosarcina limicola]|uniref:ATP-binding protein n=1 Tax=Sporosarcina limicola TaxID=34101 RepID=A0A927MKK6_9BACL|nr:hypothetical protein [Sporosarcina limicola]MBE1554857.1 hypothetical protein [Sporosarcina limicola]